MKPSSCTSLVDATKLLEELFDESSRPTIRWLRSQQARRTIPFYRIGRLVRYDLDEVRDALRQHLRVGVAAT